MSDITESQVKDWLEEKRIALGLSSLDLGSRSTGKPKFTAIACTGECEVFIEKLSSIESWALENTEEASIRKAIANHERQAAELKKSIGEEAGDD